MSAELTHPPTITAVKHEERGVETNLDPCHYIVANTILWIEGEHFDNESEVELKGRVIRDHREVEILIRSTTNCIGGRLRVKVKKLHKRGGGRKVEGSQGTITITAANLDPVPSEPFSTSVLYSD